LGITNIMADLIVLAFIGYCLFSGYRKGFFAPLMRLVGAVASFFCTYLFADKFVDVINDYFFRDGIAHLLTTRVPASAARDADALRESVAGSLSLEGVYDIISDVLSGKAVESVAEEGLTKSGEIISSVAEKISNSLSYAFVFVILFATLYGLFLLVVMAVNASFRLPVLGPINKIAGLALGGVFAVFTVCLILCVVAWGWPLISLNFSLSGPYEFIDNTVVIKFFTRHNPVSLLFRPFL